MDFEDCIKFANETPVCYLATADGTVNTTAKSSLIQKSPNR